jgi:hypothetical protein
MLPASKQAEITSTVNQRSIDEATSPDLHFGEMEQRGPLAIFSPVR